jgi:hypothetical protein
VRTAGTALSLTVVAVLLGGCQAMSTESMPLCPGPNRSDSALILMAQSVPSAAYVPCIAEFPAGWSFGGERLRNGRSEFWIDSDRAGLGAVRVILTAACDVHGAIEVPPEVGEPPMKRYEEPNVLPPTFSGNRYYVFPGGCVTYRFSFLPGATFAQVVEASEALTFYSRALGVRRLAEIGGILCGRGVQCPG